MKLFTRDLTPHCADLPDYDGHKAYGLVNERDMPITCTIVHRLGLGMHSKDGVLIECGGGWRRRHILGKAPLSEKNRATLTDGLRLTKMMSKKFAAYDYPIGGAKTVTFVHNMPEIMDEEMFREVMRVYGLEVLTQLGTYLAAEDMNTTPAHMNYLKDFAPKGTVTGFSRDVSEVTAEGIVLSTEVAMEMSFPMFGLKGMSCSIQGVGGVGHHIVDKLLARSASRIIICDEVPGRAETVQAGREHVFAVECKDFFNDHVDVHMPCGVGGTLNADTVKKINAWIICGCANNQLATPEIGGWLHQNNVVYVPDFIGNAGGVHAVVADAITGDSVQTLLQRIPEKVQQILEESRLSKRAPSTIADDMVREQVAKLRLP